MWRMRARRHLPVDVQDLSEQIRHRLVFACGHQQLGTAIDCGHLPALHGRGVDATAGVGVGAGVGGGGMLAAENLGSSWSRIARA